MTILPTMLLLGAGFAFGFSSIMAQATDGIDNCEQGLASGLVQTSGQVGAALVLAVVTALVAGGASAGGASAGGASGRGGGGGDFNQFHPGVNLVTGVPLVGLLLNLVPLLNRNRARHVRRPARRA